MKRLAFIFLSFALLFTGIILSVRAAVIHKATAKADKIWTETKSETGAAAYLFTHFQKDGAKNYPTLARLRPYLSGRLLPLGSLELLMMEGWCDDSARALSFILAQRGIDSKQWNYVGKNSAHAALVATINDKSILLDPYYGYASRKNITDKNPDLFALDQNANHDFYKNFSSLMMGAQGEALTITVKIPKLSAPLILGEIDGQSNDVKSALLQNDMSHVWTYAGHKYDRGWTRELVAGQNLQVKFILNKKPNPGVLRGFSPLPEVSGKLIQWQMVKGDKIISRDALAALSFARMNSYIEIDQIIISPEGEKP